MSLLIKVLVKALEAFEVGEKSPFLNTCQLFSLLAKHNFLTYYGNTTIYLLDLVGF